MLARKTNQNGLEPYLVAFEIACKVHYEWKMEAAAAAPYPNEPGDLPAPHLDESGDVSCPWEDVATQNQGRTHIPSWLSRPLSP